MKTGGEEASRLPRSHKRASQDYLLLLAPLFCFDVSIYVAAARSYSKIASEI